MADLRWHSFFEIGVDFIDEEHQSLLKVMQKTRDAIEARDFVAASAYLALMLSEAKAHFLSEETFLEEAKYPRLQEHKRYHEALLKKAETTKMVCENIASEHDTKKCFDDMAEFLIDDILQGDIMFKSYLEYEGYIKT